MVFGSLFFGFWFILSAQPYDRHRFCASGHVLTVDAEGIGRWSSTERECTKQNAKHMQSVALIIKRIRIFWVHWILFRSSVFGCSPCACSIMWHVPYAHACVRLRNEMKWKKTAYEKKRQKPEWNNRDSVNRAARTRHENLVLAWSVVSRQRDQRHIQWMWPTRHRQCHRHSLGSFFLYLIPFICNSWREWTSRESELCAHAHVPGGDTDAATAVVVVVAACSQSRSACSTKHNRIPTNERTVVSAARTRHTILVAALGATWINCCWPALLLQQTGSLSLYLYSLPFTTDFHCSIWLAHWNYWIWCFARRGFCMPCSCIILPFIISNDFSFCVCSKICWKNEWAQQPKKKPRNEKWGRYDDAFGRREKERKRRKYRTDVWLICVSCYELLLFICGGCIVSNSYIRMRHSSRRRSGLLFHPSENWEIYIWWKKFEILTRMLNGAAGVYVHNDARIVMQQCSCAAWSSPGE